MPIIQESARIYRLTDDALVGRGQCAIHVSDAPHDSPPYICGTVIVEWIGDERLRTPDDSGYRVQLDDGRWLNVVFTKRSSVADGPEVLRFRGSGPLRGPEPPSRHP